MTIRPSSFAEPTGKSRFPADLKLFVSIRMATTARIIDSHGNPGRLKLRRIREHEAAGAGKWQDGTFVFTRHAERSQTLRQSPAFGPFVPCRVDIHDSGQSGFLRYPLAYGVTSQPKYPGLALQGAGLA